MSQVTQSPERLKPGALGVGAIVFFFFVVAAAAP